MTSPQDTLPLVDPSAGYTLFEVYQFHLDPRDGCRLGRSRRRIPGAGYPDAADTC